jgi:hypothetical protein
MFWKVMGGIGLFFMAVVMTVVMVAAAGVAVVGAAVGSAIDNIDTSTVQVTDESGHTEIYTLGNLIEKSGQVEIIGDNGERVTIEMPQITIEEQGLEGSQIVFGGDSGLVINGPDSEVRLDGRRVDHYEQHDYGRYEGGFFSHVLGGIIGGLFKLAFWCMVIFIAYLVLRNHQPALIEKAPVSTAE